MQIKHKLWLGCLFVCLSFLLVLVIRPVSASENGIYILELHYAREDVLLKNISVGIGFAPDQEIQPDVGYKAEMISFDGTLLYSFRFDIPNTFLPAPPIGSMPGEGPIKLEEVDFALLIPYFGNGKTIDIYDQTGVKKLSIDVSQFSSGYKISKIPSSKTIERAILIVLVGGIAIMIGMILFTLYKKRGGR